MEPELACIRLLRLLSLPFTLGVPASDSTGLIVILASIGGSSCGRDGLGIALANELAVTGIGGDWRDLAGGDGVSSAAYRAEPPWYSDAIARDSSSKATFHGYEMGKNGGSLTCVSMKLSRTPRLHILLDFRQFTHSGRPSSHFKCRSLQVKHPVRTLLGLASSVAAIDFVRRDVPAPPITLAAGAAVSADCLRDGLSVPENAAAAALAMAVGELGMPGCLLFLLCTVICCCCGGTISGSICNCCCNRMSKLCCSIWSIEGCRYRPGLNCEASCKFSILPANDCQLFGSVTPGASG